MTPKAILEIIEQARRQEARSGTFLRQLRTKVAALPTTITVAGNRPATRLFQFAVEYIEMAPRLIEYLDACAQQSGRRALLSPLIETATRYFTQPSAMLAGYEGLDGLLSRAYLCHRLIEEMYENNHSTRNSCLVDIEVTQANLLAHHLIGEVFANELDHAISITALQIARSPKYSRLNLRPFVGQLENSTWDWMRAHWENLLVRNHIQFALNSA
ncbi:MAG: hypothetical protein KGY54_07700 [Oleiphilaceae bacterium]|nr:hypothetical protein [Oleiphilaceae bacterium]